MKQIRTSPYHPQTDGMVERFNSTLKRLLRKLVQNTKIEWDQCLPYVLWAYRGMVHKTTGFTPHELVFGKKMRMPLDFMVCYWQGKEETDPSNVAEYVHTLRANMEMVREMAYKREKEENVNKRSTMMRVRRPFTFSMGDFVLVFRPTYPA